MADPLADLPGASSLSLRDRRVLAALAGDGVLSFAGLRRLLGLHPQSLSRTLKRLRGSGLVEEAPGGYRLVARGGTPAALPPLPVSQSAVLASLQLASPREAQRLLHALTGRWFRDLRWLGRARAAGIEILAWMTDDGVIVRLVVDGDAVRIEVAPEAASEPPVHEAVRVLLPAIAAALSPARPPRPAVGTRLLLAS